MPYSAPAVRPAARRAGGALDSLLRLAEAASPALHAARARVAAARARVAPAGARPDPMLMAGVVNLPVARPSFRTDEMTMRMVGVGQTLPYPGKLGLQRRAAASEAVAAEAALAAARLDVARDVREAYYELAYADRALDIVQGTRDALSGVVQVAEARYGSGGTGQQDVITARVEATRVAEAASALLEQRRAALAQLNAALDRPSDTPVDAPAIPERVARAAVAGDPPRVRFAAATLGARAADSPLPPLATLQAMAVQRSPMLRQHEAMIAAQAARVELARKASRPDVDVSLQYGQRQGRPDMVTAQVSIPLPLQRAAKQDAEAAGAAADLAALEAEHHAQVNAIHAEVARLVSRGRAGSDAARPLHEGRAPPGAGRHHGRARELPDGPGRPDHRPQRPIRALRLRDERRPRPRRLREGRRGARAGRRVRDSSGDPAMTPHLVDERPEDGRRDGPSPRPPHHAPPSRPTTTAPPSRARAGHRYQPAPSGARSRRRRLAVVLGAVVLAAAFAVLYWVRAGRRAASTPAPRTAAQDASGMTGMSGMSGMNMSGDGSVTLTAAQLRQFGVTFGSVEQRTLTNEVRTVGTVTADETSSPR